MPLDVRALQGRVDVYLPVERHVRPGTHHTREPLALKPDLSVEGARRVDRLQVGNLGRINVDVVVDAGPEQVQVWRTDTAHPGTELLTVQPGDPADHTLWRKERQGAADVAGLPGLHADDTLGVNGFRGRLVQQDELLAGPLEALTALLVGHVSADGSVLEPEDLVLLVPIRNLGLGDERLVGLIRRDVAVVEHLRLHDVPAHVEGGRRHPDGHRPVVDHQAAPGAVGPAGVHVAESQEGGRQGGARVRLPGSVRGHKPGFAFGGFEEGDLLGMGLPAQKGISLQAVD